MEDLKYLPIGSVVSLKSEKNIKLTIIARMITVKLKGEDYYFEYGACIHPRGIVGENIANFNTEDIEEIIHKGYIDEDEVKEQTLIERWLQKTNVKKIDVKMFNEIIREDVKLNEGESS